MVNLLLTEPFLTTDSLGIYPPGINGEVTFHGINVSSNYFYINNHGFDTGVVIKFSSNDTDSYRYGLLTIDNYYYIHKIDDDKFKLSDAGSDLENLSRTDFDNKKFVDLNLQQILHSISTGLKYHLFNFQLKTLMQILFLKLNL